MVSSLLCFMKKETVLTVSFFLALASSCVVRPDLQYISYIDFRTLAILFSLMSVMAGLRRQGVFSAFGHFLLSKSRGTRGVILTLVFLCFFFSMFITNDVSLITFVPFTFTVLDMMGPAARRTLALPVVCMQTVAANLGSMLTPIGNPQNLYLYGKSGLSLPAFLRLMLPYTAASFLMLLLWILFLGKTSAADVSAPGGASAAAGPSGSGRPAADSPADSGHTAGPNFRRIALHAALFVLCLLTVGHLLTWQILFPLVLLAVLLFDRQVIRNVDYSLLFTFVMFFIFIGNLGRVTAFSGWLSSVLTGREVPVAVLASQVTSNVPAALLLSGFTDNTEGLIIGTNLGGLGTLIASMASLISYRQIAREEADRKGSYFRLFTVSNLLFLAVLMGLWAVIR